MTVPKSRFLGLASILLATLLAASTTKGRGVDVVVKNLRDRRLAASDEAISTKRGPIYGRGTAARRAAEEEPANFDLRRIAFSREPGLITTIILHQTTGPRFVSADLPPLKTDADPESDHRVDRINAHFVVLDDGTIVYTRDVRHILNNAGGRRGIDIEFAGDFPNADVPPEEGRLSMSAIDSGRKLLAALKSQIPTVRFVHPHGQVQREGRGKFDSCPGSDIWLNVGDWSVDELGLKADDTDTGYQNNTISPKQRNYGYFQE